MKDHADTPSTVHLDSLGRVTRVRRGQLPDVFHHWTAFDKIAEIEEPGGTTTFSYDAFGNRAARHSTVDDLTTYYFDGLYEHEIDYGQAVPTEKHKFTVYGTEGPVAHVERTASWGGFVDETSYIHRDHLGSTELITNENGAVAQRMSFDAWGRKRTATDWTSPLEFVNNSGVNVGYTGHEERIDGGKMNMRGRLYDPEVGRMASADPYVPAPLQAEGWNRFAYVLNSPLGYTDPSGYDPEDDDTHTVEQHPDGSMTVTTTGHRPTQGTVG